MSSTITVRVPKELKDELAKYGVEAGKVARRALEEEVEKRRLRELEAVAEKLGDLLSGVSDEEIVEGIREARRRA